MVAVISEQALPAPIGSVSVFRVSLETTLSESGQAQTLPPLYSR
jgi:hypothetical protein